MCIYLGEYVILVKAVYVISPALFECFSFVIAIARSMPLFMVVAWIYTVSMIVKGIVYEKEKRLKEVMKVMGLGNQVHWLAWFITSFVLMLISIIFLVLILKVRVHHWSFYLCLY